MNQAHHEWVKPLDVRSKNAWKCTKCGYVTSNFHNPPPVDYVIRLSGTFDDVKRESMNFQPLKCELNCGEYIVFKALQE